MKSKPQTRASRTQVAPRLPHERDESIVDTGASHDEMKTAERDLREGQLDTDNYTRMRDVAQAGLRKRR